MEADSWKSHGQILKERRNYWLCYEHVYKLQSKQIVFMKSWKSHGKVIEKSWTNFERAQKLLATL